MTLVSTSCPKCDRVEVNSEEIYCAMREAGGYFYSFTCPSCKERINKSADMRTVILLESVYVEISDPPFELMELRPSGPQLTNSFIVEFSSLMENPEEFWKDLRINSWMFGI